MEETKFRPIHIERVFDPIQGIGFRVTINVGKAIKYTLNYDEFLTLFSDIEKLRSETRFMHICPEGHRCGAIKYTTDAELTAHLRAFHKELKLN